MEQAAPAKRKMGCGTMAGIGLVALIGIYMIGANGVEKQEAEARKAVESGPSVKVTPEELRAAYEANEAAAQKTYGGQVLEITGKVDSIALDISDDPVVHFATSNRFDQVHASFEGADGTRAADLVKGQTITLRCGEITEVIGTPILRKCIFVG